MSDKISNSLFAQVANECVPKLRNALSAMGLTEEQVSPSLGMTASIDVDGKEARVRLDVTLNPDEDEEDDK